MSTRLGEELRRLRKEKGYTLEAAASGVDITLQYISLLEKGQRKSASFEVMYKLSRFYGVPLDYFTHFITEDENQERLTEEELEIWNVINEKVQEEIYYKNGGAVRNWFKQLFQIR